MLTFLIILCTPVALLLTGFVVATVHAIRGEGTTPWCATDILTAMTASSKEGWVHRALVAFDIACNVIFLRGRQDETISSHSWRAAKEGKRWGKAMTWWLCLFQANHGEKAACGDLQRAIAATGFLKNALGLN
jgi:hypothetical protein